MSDVDSLRVRIVKLPAALAEGMLYDGLRENDPSFASVLEQSETVLIIGASPPAADKHIQRREGARARGVNEYCRERIAELRDFGYTVDVLGEDSDVVLPIVWTEDGPMTLAIGEQFEPGRHH